jgi:hypothetical protein
VKVVIKHLAKFMEFIGLSLFYFLFGPLILFAMVIFFILILIADLKNKKKKAEMLDKGC